MGNGICEHGIHRYRCQECMEICQHGNIKKTCKLGACNLGAIPRFHLPDDAPPPLNRYQTLVGGNKTRKSKKSYNNNVKMSLRKKRVVAHKKTKRLIKTPSRKSSRKSSKKSSRKSHI
jgi:hypothetical protein